MHMVRKDMPLLDPALLLKRELSEYPAQMLAQMTIQGLAPFLGNEYHVVFVFPFRVT